MSLPSGPRRGWRRLLAPEVVQTSAMDCGPAALKCVLEGFHVPVSYGRLREACQTDVDGTSIDTLEDVAARLGLEAEQVLLPVDHLLLPDTQSLPAIVVVRLPNGNTHFVVVWRRHGPLVQVMDPATGRRWLSQQQFLRELYAHVMELDGLTWRGWATAPEFTRAVHTQLVRLGLESSGAQALIDSALADPGWRRMAELDAATRMMHDLLRGGAFQRGREAGQVLQSLLELLRQAPDPVELIPPIYWSARPLAHSDDRVAVRGAVLIRIQGLKREARLHDGEPPAQLGVELEAALKEPPEQPARQLWRLLRDEGRLALWPLLAGLVCVALFTALEVLLLRSVFELSRMLPLPRHRLGALSVLVLLSLGLLCLELPVSYRLRRLGRELEGRLRIAFLRKLPYLGDRYFQSRLSSDMAHRSHDIHRLRLLPDLADRAVRVVLELGVTTAGILLLAPEGATLLLALCAAMLLLPLGVGPLLVQADMRVRTHNGALARMYLDSLLGLMPLRAHGAERSMRREHEGLLVKWMAAGLRLHGWVTLAEGLCTLVGFSLAAWLLARHLGTVQETGTALLLAYWLLNLSLLGRELTQLALEYPAQRNATLRLLEPLGAPPSPDAKQPSVAGPLASHPGEDRGVGVELREMSICLGGQPVLRELNLTLAAGDHVAVVGPSGAGKSSLAGVLLGFHAPSAGAVRVEGQPLEGARIEWLRQHTAWVDPAVHLWNRSLLDNILYGASERDTSNHEAALRQADLLGILEALPRGLQTPLGEGGALLSGGEGQRVRFGRATYRPQARLVVMDEPFRGLDREHRRELLSRARQLWSEATLVCITHDVGETRSFPRVLVVDAGRIVEDGTPAELDRPGTLYRELLEAEHAAREELWGGPEWRKIRLERSRGQPASRRQAS
ncbi:ATP-binding cassette domain-containing protein [Corallococcus exercitus]|uniref:cysteine peptidase family C39 domain-containing protein n=1 Tax=Corallococcus exercitus TaxID=2316736 RepID=UPI000EA2ECC6|nr:cysteine peptidase family C39 domain-containing protein [Corallococcus exercitus]RKG72963.1 ATP-binding cassette domain-containing protein [Corallococcus exercitus]